VKMDKGWVRSVDYDEDNLIQAYRNLGPIGKSVLMDIAKRLSIGHERYGDFGEKKDMDMEAREELLDAIVYLTRGMKT
jgi:hypothetical protein